MCMQARSSHMRARPGRAHHQARTRSTAHARAPPPKMHLRGGFGVYFLGFLAVSWWTTTLGYAVAIYVRKIEQVTARVGTA